MSKKTVYTQVIVSVLCWFFAIVVLLIRFPYNSKELDSFEKEMALTISEKAYTIIDIKETSASVHYLLQESGNYFVASFRRFPYWNRYDMSRLISLSDDSSYRFSDFYNEGIILLENNQMVLTKNSRISVSVFIMPVVLFLNIVGITMSAKSCHNDEEEK